MNPSHTLQPFGIRTLNEKSVEAHLLAHVDNRLTELSNCANKNV